MVKNSQREDDFIDTSKVAVCPVDLMMGGT
jgi:hypothetical protein